MNNTLPAILGDFVAARPARGNRASAKRPEGVYRYGVHGSQPNHDQIK